MALRRGEAHCEFIKQITCNAGDCIIFTEATTHGTLPCDRRPRPPHRTLPPSHRATSPMWPTTGSKDMLALMTDEQRKVLEPPYHSRLDRPALEV